MHLQVHAPSLLAAAAAPPCGLWRGRHSPLCLATTTAWLATSKHQRNASLALMMLFRAAGTKMAQSLIRPAVLVVYTKTLCCPPLVCLQTQSSPGHVRSGSLPGQLVFESRRRARTHTCMHARVQVYAHTRARARAHAHTHTRACAHTHTYTHTHTHTHARRHIRVRIYA